VPTKPPATDDDADHDVENDPLRAAGDGNRLDQKLGVAVARGVVHKQPRRPMHVAVVGATGVVGRETLSILSERRFPLASLRALASARSAGEELGLDDGKSITVEDLEQADFKGVDVVFFAASGGVSKTWAPRAAAAGAVCIDKSSSFRMDADVPLVVPEVNGQALKDFGRKRIIATPNCSTIQMVQCLAPLERAVGIERVVVCTYQAVSGLAAAASTSSKGRCARSSTSRPSSRAPSTSRSRSTPCRASPPGTRSPPTAPPARSAR